MVTLDIMRSFIRILTTCESCKTNKYNHQWLIQIRLLTIYLQLLMNKIYQQINNTNQQQIVIGHGKISNHIKSKKNLIIIVKFHFVF